MVETAAVSFGVSALVLLIGTALLSVERKRGRRLVFPRARGLLDRLCDTVWRHLGGRWRHFVRYIVQLSWYYSLHAMLQACLRVIVATYHYFERVFEKNRRRTKRLRAEKRKLTHQRTHLDEVVAHKEETALTPAEQKRLKEKKLRGD